MARVPVGGGRSGRSRPAGAALLPADSRRHRASSDGAGPHLPQPIAADRAPGPGRDVTGGARPPRPRRAVVRLVVLACRALPPGDVRHRYERELVAELYGMGTARQVRYAVGVLLAVRSLRAALAAEGDGPLHAPADRTEPRRPLLCRLHLHHRWRLGFTDDGARYVCCALCGKLHDEHIGLTGPPPPWCPP